VPALRAKGSTWGTGSFQPILTKILCRQPTLLVVNDGFVWCFTQQVAYCKGKGGKVKHSLIFVVGFTLGLLTFLIFP